MTWGVALGIDAIALALWLACFFGARRLVEREFVRHIKRGEYGEAAKLTRRGAFPLRGEGRTTPRRATLRAVNGGRG